MPPKIREAFAWREETRREHLAEIRRIYGYRMLSGRCARGLEVWLEKETEAARSNEGLARRHGQETGLRSSDERAVDQRYGSESALVGTGTSG